MSPSAGKKFVPLNIAILTISDTRNQETDVSGHYLARAMQEAGHVSGPKLIIMDNLYSIRAQVSQWIADPNIQIIITTGGTGFSPRDVTSEAIKVLLDKDIPGFGELFRALSIKQIGTSTIQSRAFAGVANNTYIFCLPGSLNACKIGWENILREQLDCTHTPCNFAELLQPYS